jgi:large subunit ribosomal protein L10
MNKTEKKELVESLNKTFTEAESIVVAHYKGLSVDEMNELRGSMREAGARVVVAKNRLVKIALKDTTYEPLTSLFEGQTIIAYSTDPVSAAKVSVNFSNDNEKLVILGGAMGENMLDVDGVKQLSKMPSLDELRGKLIGLISAPATKLATIAQAPASQLARVFGAYAAKGDS